MKTSCSLLSVVISKDPEVLPGTKGWLSKDHWLRNPGVPDFPGSGELSRLSQQSLALELLLHALTPSGEPVCQALAGLWVPSCSVACHKLGRCIRSSCQAKMSYPWSFKNVLSPRRVFWFILWALGVGDRIPWAIHLSATLVCRCYLPWDIRGINPSKEDFLAFLCKGNGNSKLHQLCTPGVVTLGTSSQQARLISCQLAGPIQQKTLAALVWPASWMGNVQHGLARASRSHCSARGLLFMHHQSLQSFPSCPSTQTALAEVALDLSEAYTLLCPEIPASTWGHGGLWYSLYRNQNANECLALLSLMLLSGS